MVTVVSKRRSEWWLYAALLFSFGLWGFAWPVLMARDANDLRRRSVFPVRMLGIAFLFGGMIYASAAFGVPTFLYDHGARVVALLVVSLLLYGSQIVLLSLIYRQSRIMVGLPFGIHQVASVIGLHLLMQLSFVMVQQALNVAADRAERDQG